MIVGVGRLPGFLLDELRGLVDDPRVLIYPEFFDDKKALVNRRYARYVERLLEERRRVVVALWPDYLYEDRYGLCSLDVVWVFPIHSLEEFGRLPRCIDVVGYAADPRYRDYALTSFVGYAKQLGYDMWWLGASRREIGVATTLGFWGLDVNTGSTGLSFREIRSPRFPMAFASFLKRVANNELRAEQGVLLKWI